MKKVNILNIIVSFICLGVYMFFMLKDGSKYLDGYGVEMLYLGAGISIIFILLSFFKYIRNGIWMDIIYMVYLLIFVGGNVLSNYLGSSKKLYAVFVNYPFWIKYVVIVLLIINIITFIKSFKEEE